MRETIFPETHEQCEEKMLGKKSSEKSAKKNFYIHTNIVTNKRGVKRAKQIFRNTRILRSKMFGKNRRKKGRKNVFYFHTNIITKKCVEKNVRNNFFRNTRIVRAKNVGKKSSGKSAKKRFLCSHVYRDPKGGENARKQFSRNTRIVHAKNVG